MPTFNIIQVPYTQGKEEDTGELARGLTCVEALKDHANKLGLTVYQYHYMIINKRRRWCISTKQGWRFASRIKQ